MQLNNTFLIDLQYKNYNLNVTAYEGDTKSRYIDLQILNSGQIVNLTGHSIKVYAIKPDGTKIYNNCTITDATNGKAELELTSQILAVAGNVQAQFIIYGSDSSILSTQTFSINVEKSLRDDSAIESTDEFTALTQSINKLEAWDSQFQSKYDGLNAQYAQQLTQNTNKIGNLSTNGITETDLATAIKNDRTTLTSHTTQLADMMKQVNECTYNLDEGLRAWRQNKNKDTSIVFSGDSITASTGATNFDTGFVNLIKQALQLQHGIRGYGFQGYKTFISSGWTSANKGTNLFQWKGTTSSSNIVITEYFNEIDVIYSTETDGGDLVVNVDGVDYAMSCNGAESFHNIYNHNFGLNNGLHTLTIKKPTSGNVYIEGIIFKSSTYPYTSNQVLVHNVGHPGIRAVDYLNNPSAIKASITDFNPSLTVITLGTNDAGTQASLSDYKTALTQLVQAGLSKGSVLLVSMCNRQDGDTLTIKYSQYVATALQVAKENNCAFLSLYDLFNKQYITSLMSDNVHPNQMGHSVIADAIIQCVGGTKSQIFNISNNPYGRLTISSDNTLPLGINLGERKNDLAITTGATSITVNLSNNRLSNTTFPYSISVTPNWNTTYWVTSKGYASFVINFGTAAPTGATIDWIMMRN